MNNALLLSTDKMESKTVTNYKPGTSGRVLAAAGPVLLIAVSYLDPGKWAAAVEGGARFGFDLALLLLIISCTAILCQYLSASVAIATGKDLAQICSEEYDDVTCVFLGIEAEISIISLDLTMVLGTAYGLNVFFGIDLFICVFLTGFDAVVIPLLASLGNPKGKFLSICLASFILVFYFCGILVSQPESSLSMGGMLNKLTGENAYALMSLLGANIIPHNFYLHSSFVQQDQGKSNASKVALCQDHFFATLCVFSGIFLVNYMLLNLAANVFYSSGIVSLTLQDALSLLEQLFRSSTASVSLIVIMFFCNQLIALTWSRGGQVIVQDLFRLDIPGWLHRATIRIIVIIPALYCIWNSGAEGIFQLLIFAQVMVGLLLPSSVIPLFRVASSTEIMGTYKVSHLVEFLALVSFVGMLGLKIVFVMEMIFGSSDWVSSLKWNMGSGISVPYLTLLITAFASLCLMLLLAIIPLKSASTGVTAQSFKLDKKAATPEPLSTERGRTQISEVPDQLEEATKKQDPISLERSIKSHQNLSIPNPDLNLPEKCSGSESNLNLPEKRSVSESNLNLTTIQPNESDFTFPKPATANLEESTTISEVIKGGLLDAGTSRTEAKDNVEKIDGYVKNEKDDHLSHWEPEHATKDVSKSSQSFTSDGPGSFKSLNGSGTGSLSRLAGLGRAARRQFASILDEFWGQLFDFHGQATQEARTKKLDGLLGIDPIVDSKSSSVSANKLENMNKQSTGYPSAAGRGSDSFQSRCLSNPMKQSNIGSPLGMQQRSSSYSIHMPLVDAYGRNSNSIHSNNESGERRYCSIHVPSPSGGYDNRPANFPGRTANSIDNNNESGERRYYSIHVPSPSGGYDNRPANIHGNNRLNPNTPLMSNPSIKSNNTDSYVRQKPVSGLRTPPGFHNVVASRNSSMKSERPFHDLYSPEPVDEINKNPLSEKKYYSLPDISGLYIPQRDASLSGKSSMIYGQSMSHRLHDTNASSYSGTALGYNDSSQKVYRDAFPLQFGPGSLWSKQPYEQFGFIGKSPSEIQEAVSIVDIEAKLLQSFRSCIIKILKLEGSEWLFRQNDGADEDIMERVAAREKFLYEVESRTLERKVTFNDVDQSKFMPVPNCGEGCVWGIDLVISFGVWCIHRILDLSLLESRPELWGKYTYVLNRLQGIIDLAFSKPRSPMAPCFCLQLPTGHQQKSNLPTSKFTTSAMVLDTIKDVETAISSRKGRTGTAAGDVAFPKGKENLASVLKRYKRRLSNKPIEVRKIALTPPQSL